MMSTVGLSPDSSKLFFFSFPLLFLSGINYSLGRKFLFSPLLFLLRDRDWKSEDTAAVDVWTNLFN